MADCSNFFPKETRDDLALFAMLFILAMVCYATNNKEAGDNIASGLMGGVLMYVRSGKGPEKPS